MDLPNVTQNYTPIPLNGYELISTLERLPDKKKRYVILTVDADYKIYISYCSWEGDDWESQQKNIIYWIEGD